jgi:hypothetical protein
MICNPEDFVCAMAPWHISTLATVSTEFQQSTNVIFQVTSSDIRP